MTLMWTLPAAAICLAIALVIAAIIMVMVRSKLKSVRMERSACNYERSFRLTSQKDTFLFRNVSKIPIPRQQKTTIKR
jgi:hypothetical protein